MDKLLKSPHSTHIVGGVLIVGGLAAIVEGLGPREVRIVLLKSRIVMIKKVNDLMLVRFKG